MEEVGGAQLHLPMHFLQEYNQPKPFKSSNNLERNLPDWLLQGYLDHSLSTKWH